jgi:hypothetical protein
LKIYWWLHPKYSLRREGRERTGQGRAGEDKGKGKERKEERKERTER